MLKRKITCDRKALYYVVLHIELLLFSLGSVCSKMAGQYPFLSKGFILFYGIVILNLGLYAIVWQQIIKHIPLNTAYANKAIITLWGLLWGVLFFRETVRWNMIVGAVVVVIGVMLVVSADEK